MKRSLVLITAMLLLVACTSELDQSLNGNRAVQLKQRTLFHATIEGTNPDTKVYADDQLRVLWNKNDSISIFNKNTGNLLYGFAGEEGDNAGEFSYVSGDQTSTMVNHIYAVYPYSESTTISNDGVLSLKLPADQSYKENSFGIGANTMVSVTDDNKLLFRNVGGYLSFKLYGEGVAVKSITLKGNKGEKIAGEATVSMSDNGTPTVQMLSDATESITLTSDSPVALNASSDHYTEFWFVVPPINFTKGFSVTVTDDKGGTFEKSTSNPLDIKRNTLSRMEPIEVILDYSQTFVPFKDVNFKTYCVEHYDKNNDGEISIAEALKVPEINVCTNNIESLQGIEFFTNLQCLKCYGAATRNSSSKNNVVNGQLKSLDVSKNTQLTSLSCDSNQLTSLDVSNNTALNYLNCQFNQLTRLDVSKNTELKELYCDSNPDLTEIWLKTNQTISTFEYDANVATVKYTDDFENEKVPFSDANFKTYCVQYFDKDNDGEISFAEASEVTAIDVCTDYIESLQGIDYFPNLQHLHCSGSTYQWDTSLERSIGSGKLKSIDVSKNAQLIVLECRFNPLTSLDLSKNTQLIELYCMCNQLTSLDVTKNTLLEILYCYSNQLTSLDVSKNTQLRALVCRYNPLTILDVSKNTALEALACDYNPELTEIWLKTGQTITTFSFDPNVATVKYTDDFENEKVPFVDANFKAYCVENYDKNDDGEISIVEALEIKGINVCTDNIESLHGIEYFPNLLDLFCYGNSFVWDSSLQMYVGSGKLTNLDISKNTQLKWLNCNCNQLKSLDVSNNTQLKILECISDQLTSLDVSKNTMLEDLFCYYNQLTSLDVSKNTALRTLFCHFNQLTGLDVSKNTSLVDLNCGSNQLTGLDVSQNTALLSLSCNNNQLTIINLSKNTLLTHLICSSNQLTSLDVSKNTQLTQLYCDSNPYLTEIWLKTNQTISTFGYDTNVATVKYKD